MSYISTDSSIKKPHFGHAWRAKSGTIHGVVYLSTENASALSFDSSADARTLIAEITKAAEELERLEAESTALPAKEEEAGDEH